MRKHLRITRRLGPLAAVLSVAMLGCGAQQRAAEKLIDPQLREHGVLVERQTGGRDLELGRYRVEQLQLDEVPFDGTGPLAPDAAGRTRPTQQWRLRFSLVGGELAWQVECVGQRRQPPDHDLAAAADEPRDEVAVHCQLTGGEHRFVLRIDGSLAANSSGRLAPVQDQRAGELDLGPERSEGVGTRGGEAEHDPSRARRREKAGELDLGPERSEGVGTRGGEAEHDPSRARRREKLVEIVMWHRLWNVSRRRLPASLALIHGDAGTEAALILDSPERAWLAVELDPVERELALAALLALRLLPLGFDG